MLYLFIVIISTVIAFIVAVLIKIKYKRDAAKERELFLAQVSILNADVSYEKYETIAKRMAVGNTPLRVSGDYWDFILKNLSVNETNFSSELIEYNLSYVCCGV